MTTKIEWANNPDGSAGRTLNPTTGCDKVSPGCGLPMPGETGAHGNCYALTMAGRLKAMGQAKYQKDGDPKTSGPGFGLTLHPDVLDVPMRVKKPTTWFVNSMSDLFHAEVPVDFIARMFAVMAVTPRHTYQCLTKRPQRMAKVVAELEARYCEDIDHTVPPEQHPLIYPPWPLRNCWLGTSIESDRYTWRADHLRATPAAVRFLSLEPLLGPLPSLGLAGIDWVICGAESGRGARPMDLDWVRDIRDRCVSAGVPFFLKQDATSSGAKVSLPKLDGQVWDQMPERA